MTEDYVSFETAKLLKEKGFDEATIGYYNTISEIPEKIKFFDSPISIYDSDGLIGCIQAPTLQMAMKWLRKWHNLHCDVDYDFRLGWHIQITSLKEVVQDHDTEMKTYLPHKAVNYTTYEEAADAAIKYCLINLI